MDRRYTRRDLASYVVVFAAFYTLFQAVPSLWAETLTAQASAAALRLLGLDSSWGLRGELVYLDLLGGARPVHVYIIRECSAVHVLGVILGLIVPLKHGSWARKAAGVAMGALLVFAMNICRVMLTVYLTGYDVPPFSWLFTSPTVETYHYPISFIFGVVGIAAVVTLVDAWVLPELGDFLGGLPETITAEARKLRKT